MLNLVITVIGQIYLDQLESQMAIDLRIKIKLMLEMIDIFYFTKFDQQDS
jgi:hypothetical protein